MNPFTRVYYRAVERLRDMPTALAGLRRYGGQRHPYQTSPNQPTAMPNPETPPLSNPARRRVCASLALLPLAAAARRGFASVEKPAASGRGVDLSNLSKTIKPGDDFYGYVNEGWIGTAVRPAGYAQFGEMNAMFLRTETRIKAIIEAAAGQPPGSSKLADLYKSYVDVAAIDKAGMQPIRGDLDAILALATRTQVAQRMAHPLSHTIVGCYVFLDAGDTRRSLLHLDQQVANGRVVGLPDAGYYDTSTDKYASQRTAYAGYIAQTFDRAGVGDGAARASAILALETKLAAAQWNRQQLRDRRLNYHPMSLPELVKYAPGFPWRSFIEAAGYPAVDTVVLNTDTAIRACAALFAAAPVDTWRSYLAFHWIHNHAHLLPTTFQDASFQFYGATLAGQKTRRSRTDRGIQFVSQHLPELVGARYVEQFFKSTDRDAVDAMAPTLKQAFRHRIAQADWLDAATRSTAVAKIDRMRLRLGYPDDLRDYADVDIRPADPIGNLHRLKAAQVKRDAEYLNHPDRPYRWHLPPQSVDGSFSPQLNAVTFPAGLLQTPAFSAAADSAVNFGAIGAVLGHEIAHGFDDQGSRFDDRGNLRDWWTPAARAAFDARAEVLVTQYSAYSPLPGAPLDGRRSLGENLADLVGVTVALDAYRLYATARGIDTKALDGGLTGEQRFFLSWAQLWRSLDTEASLRADIDTGYHSPSKYRVNGVVRNLQAWYDAFDVDADAGLYLAPGQRASIW
ncbi:MAG TPA: M13 family metallopeptidase [Tahibacter sp.]|nr:M13 family metallopeptidase [Tahibacter sp.]